MARKKQIKNLKTGALSRSLSLAGLGLKAGAKAAGSGLSNLFASEAAKNLRRKAYFMEQAALLARELGELKGTLMKAGQMLGVYGEHFLPPEANQLLKTLHSQSPPVEWQEARKYLNRNLGKEAVALLEVEEEALAAASLGQVHRARVKKTGEEIVLKIQYPGVDKAIDGDLKAIRRILSLTDWLPKLPATEDLFEEVRTMLHQELDYQQELEMLEFFGSGIKDDPRYVIPKPLKEFSSRKVLAMSYEPGIPVDSGEVKELSQERRNALATAALELYFRELFEWNRVQTDPHFGNYRVRIQGRGKDQLVLYDFGAVRAISPSFMERYRKMLAGMFHNNRAAFEAAAVSLGILAKEDPQELKDLFHSLCEVIVRPFARQGEFDWKENNLPREVSRIGWEMIRRFPMRAPPREAVFLDRKMAGMFTFLSVLGAKIDSRSLLEPYLPRP